MFFFPCWIWPAKRQSTSASKPPCIQDKIIKKKTGQSIRLIFSQSTAKNQTSAADKRDIWKGRQRLTIFKGCFPVNMRRWEGEDSRCWILMYRCNAAKEQSWRHHAKQLPAWILWCFWWAVYYEFWPHIAQIDSSVFICLLEPLINMKETRFQIRSRPCVIIDLSQS